MRNFVLAVLYLSCSTAVAQTEFKTHSNGLIYDDNTMHRLGVIVDSLNLRFKACSLSHPYHALLQGPAKYVVVANRSASDLIKKGVSFEEYIRQTNVKPKSVWILKTNYEDYKGKKHISYESLGENERIYFRDKNTQDRNSGWVVNEEGKEAFYIENLKSMELPVEYGRLVQYVDCMIDTNARIFLPNASEGMERYHASVDSKAGKFISFAEAFPGKPEYPNDKYRSANKETNAYEKYAQKFRAWDSLRLKRLDNTMRSSGYWKDVLTAALDEGLESGNFDARLEFYAARYGPKEKVLEIMRRRRVVGMCSQDQSPRYHAMNICKLSAETAKWDIFLRSHLDIMNDRFERVSDGSYAWAQRKTYFKELEELDINAVDLLLGTCLRVRDVNDNHYFGNISRIGRALADVSDKDGLENRMVTMLRDNRLDPFNRLLIAYTFGHYNHNLDDESRQTANDTRLAKIMNEMPDYIRAAWRSW